MQTSFGQWLKQQRKLLDLTQAELAQRVGCALVTIQKIEEGTRRSSKQVAALLADHLAIAPQDRERFLRLARGESVGAPPPTNLPNPLTSWFGRADELAQVTRTLLRADVRLLTLVGTPGVGKTRLAVEVGRHLRQEFADGVWFVELAAVTEVAFVWTALAQAFSLPVNGQISPRQQVFDHLRERQLLLVLDNFEQLSEESPLVAELLTTSPGVKALVTSRVPLHLSGEHEVTVLPFPAPVFDGVSLEQVGTNPAVQIFVDRVRRFQADFAVTAANAGAIAALCATLDGLPLALELAAPRLRQFSAAELRRQLQHVEQGHLHWLSDGARDLPPRQRTLRHAIGWSFDLLTPTQRGCFTRLGVFSGGFDKLAALHLCSTTAEGPEAVAAHLQLLAEQNLIQAGDSGRYLVLETVRAFALEQLTLSGYEDEIRRRHAAYFVALAEADHPILSENRHEAAWTATLARNQDNLRAALHWTLVHDPTTALRLASALAHFWYVNGQWQEGIDWLQRALTAQPIPSIHSARAYTGMGVLLTSQGNNGRAERLHRLALEQLQGIDAPFDLTWTHFNYARLLVLQGRYEEGERLLVQCLGNWQQLGRLWHVGLTQTQIGVLAMERGEWERAQSLLSASLTVQREWQAEGMIATISLFLGNVERELGHAEAAIAAVRESYAIYQKLGRRADIAWAQREMAVAELCAGAVGDARRHFADSLAIYGEMGARDAVVIILEGLAGVSILDGDWQTGARLLGAAQALRKAVHLPDTVYSRRMDEQIFQPTRRQAGSPGWEAQIAVGQTFSYDEALALAYVVCHTDHGTRIP
ncbi:helix-turn-helix domain-containing protein [bacterium]|nr:helix-turn-helix domain-containing protein [bacterium]